VLTSLNAFAWNYFYIEIWIKRSKSKKQAENQQVINGVIATKDNIENVGGNKTKRLEVKNNLKVRQRSAKSLNSLIIYQIG
jgi:hypothetical protein